jgi:Secretion system C-terminal sorting domain
MKKYALLFLLFCTTITNAQCYTTVASCQGTIIARQTNGTLWARGNNQFGTVGNGTTIMVENFIPIGTDSNWTDAIAISTLNVLAIKADGTMWTWGTYGLDLIIPTQVGTDTNWESVANNSGQNFAIKSDGTLWAWGVSQGGGLGNDISVDTNVPTQVGTDANWSKVVTNTNAISVGIKTDGTLWSWGGYGFYLGYPNAMVNNAYRTPHQVGTDSNWVTASIGNDFTVALKSNGSICAWGRNNQSLFCNGVPFNTSFTSVTPIPIGTDTDWLDVSVTGNTCVALKTNGTRWGWGYNNNYALGMGLGMNSNIPVPTQLDTATDWRYLVMDREGAYPYGEAIKQDNSLYHWNWIYPSIQYYAPTLLGTVCTLATPDYEVNSSLTTFPNPVKNVLTLQCNENLGTDVVISITTMLGQIVVNNNNITLNHANECQLDVTTLSIGMYIVTLKSENKVYQTKIIKE